MPYAYVTTVSKPQTATSCEVSCEGEAGPLLMAYLKARPKPGTDPKEKMRIYEVSNPPLEVVNTLEKMDYKIIGSAANKRNFVWTLRQMTRIGKVAPISPVRVPFSAPMNVATPLATPTEDTASIDTENEYMEMHSPL